jgi:hypothetical protein
MAVPASKAAVTAKLLEKQAPSIMVSRRDLMMNGQNDSKSGGAKLLRRSLVGNELADIGEYRMLH